MAEKVDNNEERKKFDLYQEATGSAARGFYGVASGFLAAFLAKANPVYALAALPVVVANGFVVDGLREHNRMYWIGTTYAPELSALTGVAVNELSPKRVGKLLEEHKNDPRFAIFTEQEKMFNNAKSQNILTSALTGAGLAAWTYFNAKRGKVDLLHNTLPSLGAGAAGWIAQKIIAPQSRETWPNSVNSIVSQVIRANYTAAVEPRLLLHAYERAQPAIAAVIQQKFHAPYIGLPYHLKLQAVDMLEPVLHLKEVAQKMNTGVIRPAELGWLAYGLRSGVKERMPVTASVKLHPEAAPVIVQQSTQHVEKLNQQRVAEANKTIAVS